MRRPLLLIALAALAGAAGPATAAQRGIVQPPSVVATIGHSEWCRPGSVFLNIDTGHFIVRAPRRWRSCRRPAYDRAVRQGDLPIDRLNAVRTAWQRARLDGLEHRACRNGGRPPRLIISNGGRPGLRLTTGGRTTAAPRDESCWSEAALALHGLLERQFDLRPR